MSNVARRVPLVGGLVLLVAGVWLGTRLLREDAPGAAAPAAPAVAVREPGVLPDFEAPSPASVPSADAASAAAPPAATPGAAPGPPAPAAVWDDVYYVLDGLAQGGLTGEDALRLADELLARVATAGPPEVSEDGNRLTWTLLDDPNLGTLKFTQLKQPGEQQHEFEVAGDVAVRPGAYTGHREDGAAQTRFQLVLSADPYDKLGHVSVVSQTNPRQELALSAERGKDMPVGGAITVLPEGTTWRPLVVQNATEDGGDVTMMYRMLDPVPTTGSLADSRSAGLGQRVAKLRGR